MASGIVGMFVAVKSNLRTAAAAQHSVADALRISLRGGAVSGILVVGLSLIGVFVMFIASGGFAHPEQAPFTIVGFGFGASFVALFAQLGGGIYTKAADLGADLVGRVEAGILEDDQRNAAVIADLVGDNVGDCAGMAADDFESFEVTIVSALILGLVLGRASNAALGLEGYDLRFVIFPLILRGIGVIASVIGNAIVRTDEQRRNAMAAMNRGFYLSAVVAVIGFAIVSLYYMIDPATKQVD